MIFAYKLSDDFSGFVDTCGTGKRNRAGGGRSYWEMGQLPPYLWWEQGRLTNYKGGG